MAIRFESSTWSPGDILFAEDLNDTFAVAAVKASKMPTDTNEYTGTVNESTSWTDFISYTFTPPTPNNMILAAKLQLDAHTDRVGTDNTNFIVRLAITNNTTGETGYIVRTVDNDNCYLGVGDYRYPAFLFNVGNTTYQTYTAIGSVPSATLRGIDDDVPQYFGVALQTPSFAMLGESYTITVQVKLRKEADGYPNTASVYLKNISITLYWTAVSEEEDSSLWS